MQSNTSKVHVHKQPTTAPLSVTGLVSEPKRVAIKKFNYLLRLVDVVTEPPQRVWVRGDAWVHVCIPFFVSRYRHRLMIGFGSPWGNVETNAIEITQENNTELWDKGASNLCGVDSSHMATMICLPRLTPEIIDCLTWLRNATRGEITAREKIERDESIRTRWTWYPSR